jgi:NTP pyrophosphatase (non-canonical NTP hydrolase)
MRHKRDSKLNIDDARPLAIKGQTASDAETTIQDLRAEVYQFNDDRDWHQFHTPKNLAAAISIEAAELLEHFQWSDELPPERLPKLAEELADVVVYCLTLSNVLDIDLSQAVRQKMARNAAKYPTDEYRGRF